LLKIVAEWQLLLRSCAFNFGFRTYK